MSPGTVRCSRACCVIVAPQAVKIESVSKVSTWRKAGVVARVAGQQVQGSRTFNALMSALILATADLDAEVELVVCGDDQWPKLHGLRPDVKRVPIFGLVAMFAPWLNNAYPSVRL